MPYVPGADPCAGGRTLRRRQCCGARERHGCGGQRPGVGGGWGRRSRAERGRGAHGGRVHGGRGGQWPRDCGGQRHGCRGGQGRRGGRGQWPRGRGTRRPGSGGRRWPRGRGGRRPRCRGGHGGLPTPSKRLSSRGLWSPAVAPEPLLLDCLTSSTAEPAFHLETPICVLCQLWMNLHGSVLELFQTPVNLSPGWRPGAVGVKLLFLQACLLESRRGTQAASLGVAVALQVSGLFIRLVSDFAIDVAH
mmetsp:Transcript_22764/g.63313  ORF Transcript_22764/g.63313 Transcript_22764/m.63313 type:complete len:248 (-) Transcript_22764:60-803(-)